VEKLQYTNIHLTNTRSSSFTWRSILFGRELIVKGLRWGVGDGSKIKIMGDNWIPGLPSGTFSTLESLPANAPVIFLMNSQGNAWDMDTIRFFSTEEMARVIQQIPISRHGGEDYVSWPHAKFGQYTARSAYNLARTASFYTFQSTAGRGRNSDVAV
jgi:hypothetical protein